MSEQTHSDLTLPTFVSALPGQYETRPLVCTIIFHPETRRIGERYQVSSGSGNQPLVIGRNGPDFGCNEEFSRSPINDPHVSRRALVLRRHGSKLFISRPVGASRAQVNGVELQGEAEFKDEQLRSGVPILLAHSVVLLLRYDFPRVDAEGISGDFGLLGCSNYMSGVRSSILRAAGHGEDVLVLGETGSGKELVARAIHGNSPRAKQPLVSVNMAAVPAELAAAALFGHAKGAFTGASSGREGYFRQADGGTLFLDEVGDTPLEVQPQLLRALQESEVQAVGGGLHAVSVRVISATDVQLDSPGSDFRSALRYRLGALEIRLLPLREHPEDIGVLALHFFSIDDGTALDSLVGDQLQIARWANVFHQFLLHSWPGNVRELANACRQVMMNSDIAVAVPEAVGNQLQIRRGEGGQVRSQDGTRSIHDVEESEFEDAWQESCYEPAGTARLLGVSRQSVYRRIDGSERYRLAGQVEHDELLRVLRECGHDSVLTARRLQVSLSALRTVLRTTDFRWR